MNFISFMFSSVYDQVALVLTAVLLLINVIVDVVKQRRRSVRRLAEFPQPKSPDSPSSH